MIWPEVYGSGAVTGTTIPIPLMSQGEEVLIAVLLHVVQHTVAVFPIFTMAARFPYRHGWDLMI